MLKLTRKLEYALIALSHMQRKKNNELSSTKEIAETYAIPQEILAKTLQHLAKLDIIDAIQGSHGGYKVKVALNEVNLIDFFEKMEGPIGLVDCNIDADCVLEDMCNIRKPIRAINKNIRSVFSRITLSEITQ